MAFDTKVVLFDLNSNSNSNINNTSTKKTLKFDRKICKLCHKTIRDSGLQSINHDLIFCDLICAKIYSDNIDKINIDYDEYRRNFCNNKLSNKSLDVYKKYKGKFFVELPILKFDKDIEAMADDEYKDYILKCRKMYM